MYFNILLIYICHTIDLLLKYNGKRDGVDIIAGDLYLCLKDGSLPKQPG
jgi:hypothetical protein